MYGNCVDCKKPTNEIDLHGGGMPRCLPCKRAKLGGRKPRELTFPEVRTHFLNHVWGLIEYWLKESRAETTQNKLEGLAFSILSALDGSSVGLPGFIVAPAGHPDDAAWSREHEEDWFPHNGKDIQHLVKCDIGGGLHEHFHKHCPKWMKEERKEWKSPTSKSGPGKTRRKS